MHLDGTAGTQPPRQQSAEARRSPEPAKESAAQTLRRLLSDREAAAVVGVGERTYADWVAQGVPWLPEPINLGPRLRRWDLDELLQAVRTRAPRGKAVEEPAQLRRARIERLKAGATL